MNVDEAFELAPHARTRHGHAGAMSFQIFADEDSGGGGVPAAGAGAPTPEAAPQEAVEEQGPAWETSKENVQPLRRGRNVKALSRGLSLSTAATAGVKDELAVKRESVVLAAQVCPAMSLTQQRTRRAFEAAVAPLEGQEPGTIADDVDMITPWKRYESTHCTRTWVWLRAYSCWAAGTLRGRSRRTRAVGARRACCCRCWNARRAVCMASSATATTQTT